jgi:hypothetical protein
MKNTTHIHNKFTGYTLRDCSCEYCLYKNRRGCTLDQCCCLEERLRAIRREREAREAAQCRA